MAKQKNDAFRVTLAGLIGANKCGSERDALNVATAESKKNPFRAVVVRDPAGKTAHLFLNGEHFVPKGET